MDKARQRPARSERPSIRVLLVPRLLARGLAPEQAASLTGVPLALVLLIEQQEPSAPTVAARCTGRIPTRAGQPSAVRLRRLATLAVYAAGCALTVLWHQPIMPLAVAAAALISTTPHG